MAGKKLKIARDFSAVDMANLPPVSGPLSHRPVLLFSETPFSPPTDVWETGDAVFVRMELAAVETEGLEVQYRAGMLQVSGRRPEPALLRAPDILRFHQKEIDYGTFRLKIKLHCRIDSGGIRASFAKGMLQIRLPKLPAAVPPDPLPVTVEIEKPIN